MIDIFTKLSMAIGKSQEDNNELYESENPWGGKTNWKLDVILEYITTHSTDRTLVNKCVQMAKDFKLGEDYENETYWREKIKDIKEGTKKEGEKVKKASKTIQSISYDYGCGSSHSYGCGISRSSSSYGCGSSRSYGC